MSLATKGRRKGIKSAPERGRDAGALQGEGLISAALHCPRLPQLESGDPEPAFDNNFFEFTGRVCPRPVPAMTTAC